MTFPETKTILDGVNVPNLKADEIQCILNLRDAWKKDINFTTATIDGRYTNICYCVNEQYKERIYIIDGNGTLNKKNEKNSNTLHIFILSRIAKLVED